MRPAPLSFLLLLLLLIARTSAFTFLLPPLRQPTAIHSSLRDTTNPLPSLPPFDPSSLSGDEQTLHLNGPSIKLDSIGPIILNADGTTKTIANWDELDEVEKDVAWRRIATRNKERKEKLLSSPHSSASLNIPLLSTPYDELINLTERVGNLKEMWSLLRQGVDPFPPSPSPPHFSQRFTANATQIFEPLSSSYKILETSRSSDNTTKLLLSFPSTSSPIEVVIIPFSNRRRSTLCISSQIGCKQACGFCATGLMGLRSNLSANQILLQVFAAMDYIRREEITSPDSGLFEIDNIVFMGMGEPLDNAVNVKAALQALISRKQFALAPTRVTLSTVGLTPDSLTDALDPNVFGGNDEDGGGMFGFAWSIHAADDTVRKLLVPTTKFTIAALTDGLVKGLNLRKSRHRKVMLQVALCLDMNDKDSDADGLIEVVKQIEGRVEGSKVMVNIIPCNEIEAGLKGYQPPSEERVFQFSKRMRDIGVFAFVRTTRGDEKSSACGQLTTKRQKIGIGRAEVGEGQASY
jgi:23S rRNA (adenine2503-C2)-methyltransferase